MKHILMILILVLASSCTKPDSKRLIALHEENTHYFDYKDKPTVLITSAEHYGAVINLDFDYVTYLETLAGDNLNLTRVFTGAYVEPAGAFKIDRNTLAPMEGRFICPWARSETSGYANGGNKFDLTRWDEAYFKRLHDFMREADKRNIIVELTLFCPFYGDEQWALSPMNATNNVNGSGPDDRTAVYTMDRSGELLAVQERLVRKIVEELKEYPNLIYEICNEPYFGGVTIEWQHHVAGIIRDAEKDFQQKHLISQNIANGTASIKEPLPGVSVFNFHYATPPRAVADNFHLNKVIGDNETGFKGNADSTYRKEGWAFIFAGGALYNNLDYSFTADHENGTFQYPATQPGGGTPALRKQLSRLRSFIEEFDFIHMRPDSSALLNAKAYQAAHVLAEAGKQYGLYIFGKGPHEVSMRIPAGSYSVEFIDPLTGTREDTKSIESSGEIRLTTPPYQEDVAIKISR